MVISAQGESFKYILQLHFPASNNIAEYEALLLGLHVAKSLDIKRVKILDNSVLVISQVNKEWACNDVNMMAYCQEIRKLENNFEGLEYGHTLRGRNETADELAKLRSSRGAIPPGVFLHRLDQPSIKKEIARLTGEVEPEAMEPLQPSSTKSEPSEVMVISLTGEPRSLFIYKQGSCQKTKMSITGYGDGLCVIRWSGILCIDAVF